LLEARHSVLAEIGVYELRMNVPRR
jgi:hypothetical protein